MLGGQGDIEYKVVGPETWKWITSPRPNFGNNTYLDEIIPLGALHEFSLLDPQGQSNFSEQITIGSWENDRAIYARGKDFDNMKDLLDWIKQNNMTVDDEYHGCIY